MLLRQITDDRLAQYAYLIGCQRTREAILFDPERDIDRYAAIAARHGLQIVAVAETHIHADFLSGAREAAERWGARVFVSAEGGPDWQSSWVKPYAHTLLHHNDTFTIGGIEFRALHTPGHTPEHIAYLVTDRGAGASDPIGLISGDFVFVGDLGRPDLLETAAGRSGTALDGARALWKSARSFCELGDDLQVWPGHGAGSACGKALGAVPQSTVGYERRTSHILQLVTDEQAFIADILSGQPEPPLYFARMKMANRDGVPVLGALPQPMRVDADSVTAHAADWERPGTVVIDTRPWPAFRDGHLPGAIFAPLGSMFPMVVGSYAKPDERVVLVCDDALRDELIRDLVRIGYDSIIATLSPAALAGGAKLDRTPEVSVTEASKQLGEAFVLDVRSLSEAAQGAIEGSTQVAYTRLATQLQRIPRGRRVLVHCALGGRSAAATSMLRRIGVDAVNVAGGFEAWKREGLPTQIPAVVGATKAGGCCGGRCVS
jgi:hydroxyacylglutathione hydrolase